MSAYKILLFVHGGLGLLALVTFWLAGLTRKGSGLHKRVGKLYLLAMAALLLPALPLSIRILLFKSGVFGAFLLYLQVLTGTSVWTSWRAIRDKRDWRRYVGNGYRALAWANLVGGAAILIVGLFIADFARLVLVAFSAIGLINFFSMRRFSAQAPNDPRWWLREHVNGMIGNGVATHIAFLSLGLPKLLPMLAGPALQTIAWLGPLVVATAAGAWLRRKYLPAKPANIAALTA